MSSIVFKTIALSVFCVSIGIRAAAGIVVVPNLIELDATDSQRTDVTVINEDEDEAYIKVTPRIILNPGTPKEKAVIIRNPQQYGLLVSPQHFIIPPKQKRLVRFILSQNLEDKERIYRVDIVPLAKEIIPKSPNQTALGLQLLVGYGVLLIARPTHPELRIAMHRQGKTLYVENKGNTNVQLQNIEQCQGKTCYDLTHFTPRLYAGNKQSIALKIETPVKLTAQLSQEQKILTSN